MILIDRILRHIMKDHLLPRYCYANKKDFFCKSQKCDCKIWCKKPPNGGIPAYQEIITPKSDNIVFKYTKK
jgi:hypothetical protein